MGADAQAAYGADRLKKVTKVYSHKSCPDGTAGAMICVRAFAIAGMDVDLEFVQYNSPEHDGLKPAPGQLFVDITPPATRWREWEGMDPIVLDHHDGEAKEAVEGLGGVYGNREQSGASLAFDHVMVPLVVGYARAVASGFQFHLWKEFARMAALRDTWQEDHEDFEKALGMMRCLAFHGSKDLIQQCRDGTVDLGGMFQLGKKLHENAVRKAELIARGAYFWTTDFRDRTYKLGILNCTENVVSEACHSLLNDHGCDMAASFFYAEAGGDGGIHVSLRSQQAGKGGKVDVSKVASALGGGGRQPTAGFRLAGARRLCVQDVANALTGAFRRSLEG
jgi:hypothetical protein